MYMYTCRLSLQGRLNYANSIMDDIVDSADRPLEVQYDVAMQQILLCGPLNTQLLFFF